MSTAQNPNAPLVENDLESYIRAARGNRRWYGRLIAFSSTALAAGAQATYTLKLGTDTNLFFDSMVCDGTFNSKNDARTNETEITCNIYDSRQIVKWFYPQPLPLTLAFGDIAGYPYMPPSYFFVPKGNDLIIEFTNLSSASYSTDLNILFGAVQAY